MYINVCNKVALVYSSLAANDNRGWRCRDRRFSSECGCSVDIWPQISPQDLSLQFTRTVSAKWHVINFQKDDWFRMKSLFLKADLIGSSPVASSQSKQRKFNQTHWTSHELMSQYRVHTYWNIRIYVSWSDHFVVLGGKSLSRKRLSCFHASKQHAVEKYKDLMDWPTSWTVYNIM